MDPDAGMRARCTPNAGQNCDTKQYYSSQNLWRFASKRAARDPFPRAKRHVAPHWSTTENIRQQKQAGRKRRAVLHIRLKYNTRHKSRDERQGKVAASCPSQGTTVVALSVVFSASLPARYVFLFYQQQAWLRETISCFVRTIG